VFILFRTCVVEPENRYAFTLQLSKTHILHQCLLCLILHPRCPAVRLLFQNQIYWYTNSSNGRLYSSISIIDNRKDEPERFPYLMAFETIQEIFVKNSNLENSVLIKPYYYNSALLSKAERAKRAPSSRDGTRVTGLG